VRFLSDADSVGLDPESRWQRCEFSGKKQKQFLAFTKLKKLIILTQGLNEENNNKHIVPTSEQEP
jgi:hypothetical protein